MAMRRVKNPYSVVILYLAGLVSAGAVLPGAGRRDSAPENPGVVCRAELRSWVVAGRGRHLYLVLDCPEPYAYLSGRIEFGAASLRDDYRAPADRERAERVTRMTRGAVLSPPATGYVDNRLEGVFELTPEQAECLQRDRMWSARYVLIGSNSNSAMRRTLADCGCQTPDRVLSGAGLFGEFPGIDAPLGSEIQGERWGDFGVPGPTEAGAELMARLGE